MPTNSPTDDEGKWIVKEYFYDDDYKSRYGENMTSFEVTSFKTKENAEKYRNEAMINELLDFLCDQELIIQEGNGSKYEIVDCDGDNCLKTNKAFLNQYKDDYNQLKILVDDILAGEYVDVKYKITIEKIE